MNATRQHDPYRGFTILEIVIAIAVLALLAGTIVPMVGSTMADSKKAQAQSEVKAIAEAIGRYRLDVGTYPPGEQNSTINCWGQNSDSAIASLSNTLVNGTKKYLSKAITRDPWGRPYWYHLYSVQGIAYQDVVVISCGPDGVMNTWDSNAWNRGTPIGDDIIAFFDL
jgi:general secretion pathway protein G